MATFSGTSGNDDSVVLGFDNSGNDVFFGRDGLDSLFGGAGKDTILGQDGADSIEGGAENDRITGGEGNDTIKGDSGNDEINGGAGADDIDGGADIDRVVYTTETSGITVTLNDNVAISAGAAAGDRLVNVEYLDATTFNDKIGGNADNNWIRLYDGADIAYGFAGDDTLSGGDGYDRLYGGNDNDELLGGEGFDQLWGGLGADRHVGGAGRDTARYDDANYGNLEVYLFDYTLNVGAAAVGDRYISIENLRMGIGDDIAHGDGTANEISGYSGNDSLYGLDGDDTLNGNAGADELFGGEGQDTLNGNTGNDVLDGGEGNDVLNGQKGHDTVTGGAGDDTFVFGQLDNSNMTITDLEAGDSIDITNWGFADAAEFVKNVEVFDVTDIGGAKTGVGIRFDPGELIFIDDAAYTFDENANFIF